MYQNNDIARWAVRGRCFATAGVGLVIAIGYLTLQPALAQEKKAASANSATDRGAKLQEIEQRAQAALATPEPESKPTKPTPATTTESFDIIKVIREGGIHMWAVYAILAVSIVAVAFAIERLLGLRRSKILPTDLSAGLRALADRRGEFDFRHAQRLCRQYPSSGAVVVRAMLAKIGRPLPEIEHAVSETTDREATLLYANVRWQNLAFNVAPMLGLAGTVHGMILAFFTTAHIPLGVNKMEHLATGIYAALVCTFAGLIVAIPAGVLSHFFEGRILRLMNEVDEIARMVLPRLERFEGRPRFAKGAAAEPGAIVEMQPPEPAAEIAKPKWPTIAPHQQKG